MSALFTPFALKDVLLRNRIGVPAMCQYSADDGMPGAWHLPHYTAMARGGAGLVTLEATAVSPNGRITHGCLGLWNDAQVEALRPIAQAIKAGGAVPGIQISHSGRKGSIHRPWEGEHHFSEDDPLAWEIIGPSSVAFGGSLPRAPRAMTLEEIAQVQADFAAAARRASEAGFEWLELHFGHGYLAQCFFSIHANLRKDAYGGDCAARGRFLVETVAAVRKTWPERLPLTARFGVIEFDGRDDENLEESLMTVKRFRDEGLDLLNVSLGFTTSKAKIPWVPGLMLPIAGRFRRETGLPVSSAWSLHDPEIANRGIADGQIDIALIGRGHLANPHWAFEAARQLKIERPYAVLPPQYAHWLARYGKGSIRPTPDDLAR